MDSSPNVGQSRLWNARFILLMCIGLVSAMGFNMMMTIISLYAVSVGAGLTVAGVIAGVFSLAALLIRPVGGFLTDIMNKKRLCMIATALIGLCSLGYAFSGSIPMLAVLRVLHGAAFGISSSATVVLVSRCIPAARMAEGIGYYGLGQVIAQVCGPSLGLYVRDRVGYDRLFLLIAALSFLAAFLYLFLRYEEKDARGGDRPSVSLDRLIAVECVVYALVGGMFSLCNGVVNSFLILAGEQRGIQGLGLFFSVSAAAIFVLRLVIGRFIDKADLTFVVDVSLAFGASSMLFIGIAPSLGFILAAAIMKAVGHSAAQISLQTACINKVSPLRTGVAVSTFYIGADIGQGFGPILGGEISNLFGYKAMFISYAVLMIAVLMLFTLYQRRTRSKLKVDRAGAAIPSDIMIDN
jgi:predicted MFS family arabinose efflux permease